MKRLAKRVSKIGSGPSDALDPGCFADCADIVVGTLELELCYSDRERVEVVRSQRVVKPWNCA